MQTSSYQYLKSRIRSYRFGFNGKLKDNETYGEGNAYDFGDRMYDPRTCKMFSIDSKFKSYPYLSPYCFAANSPIMYIDFNGEGPILAIVDENLANQVNTLILNHADQTTINALIYKAVKEASDNNKPSPVVNLGDAGPGKIKFVTSVIQENVGGGKNAKQDNTVLLITSDPLNLNQKQSKNITAKEYNDLVESNKLKKAYEEENTEINNEIFKKEQEIEVLKNTEYDDSDPVGPGPELQKIIMIGQLRKQISKLETQKGHNNQKIKDIDTKIENKKAEIESRESP